MGRFPYGVVLSCYCTSYQLLTNVQYYYPWPKGIAWRTGSVVFTAPQAIGYRTKKLRRPKTENPYDDEDKHSGLTTKTLAGRAAKHKMINCPHTYLSWVPPTPARARAHAPTGARARLTMWRRRPKHGPAELKDNSNKLKARRARARRARYSRRGEKRYI